MRWLQKGDANSFSVKGFNDLSGGIDTLIILLKMVPQKALLLTVKMDPMKALMTNPMIEPIIGAVF